MCMIEYFEVHFLLRSTNGIMMSHWYHLLEVHIVYKFVAGFQLFVLCNSYSMWKRVGSLIFKIVTCS